MEYNTTIMKKFKILLIITLSILSIQQTRAQGCSDAGFCTIEGFTPLEFNTSDSISEIAKEENPILNQIKIGANYGKADHNIFTTAFYGAYSKKINHKLSADLKITALNQNGNEVNAFNVSDIFLTSTYKFTKEFSVTSGFKIPLNQSNQTLNDLPLPMDYQSSLGTFDLMVGLGYEIKKIQLVFAYQQPLTQNKNEYLSSDYSDGNPLSTYQSTNKYIRKGDVLFRVSYPLSITNKLVLTPSILPIYHLGNDEYSDENNNKVIIEGSEGLTLNGNIYVDYKIDRNSNLQLNYAIPFIVRDVRPDGLTRSWLINLEYSYRF